TSTWGSGQIRDLPSKRSAYACSSHYKQSRFLPVRFVKTSVRINLHRFFHCASKPQLRYLEKIHSRHQLPSKGRPDWLALIVNIPRQVNWLNLSIRNSTYCYSNQGYRINPH